MKLCSTFLMLFGRNFCEKRQVWVCEPHFGDVRGDARPWLMARWKAHGRLSVRLSWTFLTVYYGSGVMRQNAYNSAVFTGVDLFALKFYLDRVVPINRSWHHKTRDTGLLDGEDRIPLCSPVLTQYRSVTDRRTHGFAVADAGLAKLLVPTTEGV